VPLLDHFLVAQWVEYGDVAIDGDQKQMEQRRRATRYIECYIKFTKELTPQPHAQDVLQRCREHDTKGDRQVRYRQTQQDVVGCVF